MAKNVNYKEIAKRQQDLITALMESVGESSKENGMKVMERKILAFSKSRDCIKKQLSILLKRLEALENQVEMIRNQTIASQLMDSFEDPGAAENDTSVIDDKTGWTRRQIMTNPKYVHILHFSDLGSLFYTSSLSLTFKNN